MRILIATDGSACSDSAVKDVARRPWPPESEVRVITVIELPVAPTPEPWMLSPDFYDEVERSAREHAEEVIAGATAQLRSGLGADFAITGAVITGSPKRAILEEVDRWQADLIVVGSHGYRGWERFLLGSVSQAVALHAKCSVEVVRCRGQEGGGSY